MTSTQTWTFSLKWQETIPSSLTTISINLTGLLMALLILNLSA